MFFKPFPKEKENDKEMKRERSLSFLHTNVSGIGTAMKVL
jgi:hypothetical protein